MNRTPIPESFVTIATYAFIGDANVAKSALDAAGIDSYIQHDLFRLSWFDRDSGGGVKLKVRTEDALRAAEVLESDCRSLEEIPEADEEAPEPPVCPECGSTRLVPSKRGQMFVIIAATIIGVGVAIDRAELAFLAVIAAAIYLLIADRWRCLDCGD